MCGWKSVTLSLCFISLYVITCMIFRDQLPRLHSRRAVLKETEDINMSATLFEMALLKAISDFGDERERMLYKENPQNGTETLALPPRSFNTLVKLLQDITKEQSNISVGTGVMEKDGKGIEKNTAGQDVISEINRMLEKIYLEANLLQMLNNESSVSLVLEDVTTSESSIKESQPMSKEIILIGVSDTGNGDANTTQDHNSNLMKHVVMESIAESNALEGSLRAAQMLKVINKYLQNVSLANERVEMINTSYLNGDGQKFSELLAKLNQVIATASKVLTMDKKEDIVISESILLKILNLSNNALQDLNGRLSGNMSLKTANTETDKSFLMKNESKQKISKQNEFDQINHFVQMFYKLEGNLSNLKIFLETHKNGKKHELAERLLDQSLNVLTQLEQIPWLKGKNSFIDFELEALRDFAGVLSDVEFTQHEPSVEST